MEINKIGIVGSGQMGGGIAQVGALKGFDVTVLDISDEELAKGREPQKQRGCSETNL